VRAGSLPVLRQAFRHGQKSGIRLAAAGITWIVLQGSETFRFGARPIAIEQFLYASERNPYLRQCSADPESSRGQLRGPAVGLARRHRTQKGAKNVRIREPRVCQRKAWILGDRRFEIGDALAKIVLAQLVREVFSFEVILLSFEIGCVGGGRLNYRLNRHEEAIPESGKRFYVPAVSERVPQDLAKGVDRGIQTAIEVYMQIGPELPHQLFPSHQQAGIPQEQLEYLKRLVLKPYSEPPAAQLAQLKVDFETSKSKLPRTRR
jgi:hypothetical protein